MGGFKFGSPRGLFVVLCVGGGISLVLMLLSIWLTDRQTVYSDAINNAGRLRFLTERFGSHLMTEKLLGKRAWTRDQLLSAEEVFRDVSSICSQLLGEAVHERSTYSAPQIPDSTIRNELGAWKKQLNLLNETGSAMANNNTDPDEVLRFKSDVVHLVDSMDNIVSLLSGEAQYWIWIMLRLHLIRLAWQAFFYFWLTMVFKWLWIPFVKTYKDLQSLQQQQHSLLRADFDAVVEISTSNPYEIRRSCTAFDDLVGKPMLGESILHAASTDRAKASLESFLSTGVHFWVRPPVPSPRQKSCIGRLGDWWRSAQFFAWPTMETPGSYDCPLAPKINSKLTCDVELLIVGRSVLSEEDKIALLAVRQIGHVVRERAHPSHGSLRSSPSMDFASWSEALQVKIKGDSPNTLYRPEGSEHPPVLSAEAPVLSVPEIVGKGSSADVGYAIPASRRSGTSRTSRSSLSWQHGNYTKRKLLDLGRMEVTLDEMTELKAYTLNFANDEVDMTSVHGSVTSRGRPDFMSCLVGKPKNAFIRWWQESTNTLLYGEDLEYLDYQGEVWFRPPTAACTTPKLVLCAESVRCVRSVKDSSFRWSLQFFNISQLVKSHYPSGGQLAAQRLPSLTDIKEASLSL